MTPSTPSTPTRSPIIDLHLTHSPTVALASMEEVPSPISKLLFEEAEPRMTALREYIARQSWSTEYEVVPSTPICWS